MSDTISTNDWPSALSYRSEFPEGSYDQNSHLHHIYPPDQARVSKSPPAYFVGSAGVDGIEFAMRPELSGIWAYHPIEQTWTHVAKDLAELDRDWRAGRISV